MCKTLGRIRIRIQTGTKMESRIRIGDPLHWKMERWDLEFLQNSPFQTVLRIRDVYPGSVCFPSRIPDPNLFHSGSTSKIEVFQPIKLVSKLSEIRSRLFIPDPGPGWDLAFLPIPDPGSGSATLIPDDTLPYVGARDRKTVWKRHLIKAPRKIAISCAKEKNVSQFVTYVCE
jgi:hypothetical protein